MAFENHRYCKKCVLPFRQGQLFRGVCEGCAKLSENQEKNELKQSDNRAVGKAAYEFLAHIQKAKDKATVGPAIFESLLEKLGGKEGLTDKFIEDFNAVRGADGIASAAVKYWGIVHSLRQEYDESAVVDVGTMSDDDLIAVIQPVAERILKSDKAMRLEVIRQMMNSDPDFKKEVMEIGGAIVLDQEKKKEEPLALDYEEFDGGGDV